MRLRTMIFLGAVAASATMVAVAAGPGPDGGRMMADKVVAVVGGSPVLYSEVAEQARAITEHNRANSYTSPRDPMSEALEMLLEQKLLYQRALIDSIGLERLAADIAQAVETNVEEMVARAGSIRALESEHNKPLYTIKDDMRQQIEEVYGAQEMRGWVTGPDRVKVTPGEVERFFRKLDTDSLPIIPMQYVYAQITREPRSVELAKQRTRERLLDMRQRVIDGERFEVLARSYSVDQGSAARGGEYDPAPLTTWVEPFREAVRKLQPGQTSGVVETEYGFHIIQMIGKSPDDLYHVRHILLKPTYSDEELRETTLFLDSLARVIRAGEISFADAALQHSSDKATRMNGGVVSNQQILFRLYRDTSPKSTSTRFYRDAIDQYDAQYLIRMQEGEVSSPFVGQDLYMNQIGKILKLVQVIPAHKANPAEDWVAIEGLALSRKQDAEYNSWLNSKIDEMYVRIDPMFSPDDFDNKRWFK